MIGLANVISDGCPTAPSADEKSVVNFSVALFEMGVGGSFGACLFWGVLGCCDCLGPILLGSEPEAASAWAVRVFHAWLWCKPSQPSCATSVHGLQAQASILLRQAL